MINATPGPWEMVKDIPFPDCEPFCVIEHERGPVALIPVNWLVEGMDQANANLICAAPKMYEEIKAMLECAESDDIIRAAKVLERMEQIIRQIEERQV